mgnify:CR=1 FL=1
MDDSRIRTAAELISALISPKAAREAGTWAEVTGAWAALAGDRAGAHSRITDMDNHVVTVEVDHPGWIQMLQFRQARLLTEIQERFPALEVRALQFRLARKGGAAQSGEPVAVPRDDRAADPGQEPAAEPTEPLRLDPGTVGDEALRKALSGLRDAFEGR